MTARLRKPELLEPALIDVLLTVKLRGRIEAPANGAEGAQSLSARGAIPEAPHGPLQRLLDRCRLLATYKARRKVSVLSSVIDDHLKMVINTPCDIEKLPAAIFTLFAVVPKPRLEILRVDFIATSFDLCDVKRGAEREVSPCGPQLRICRGYFVERAKLAFGAQSARG